MKIDLARLLGKNVRAQREQRAQTQLEFAKSSGLPVAFLRRIERGVVTNPSLDRLQLIAEGLDLHVADLFKSDERPDYAKADVIEQTGRMLRWHTLSEIKAVKVLIAQVFAIQRLAKK